jgi:hypothetical protein
MQVGTMAVGILSRHRRGKVEWYSFNQRALFRAGKCKDQSEMCRKALTWED